MLLRQHGRGHEHRDLLPVHDGLERGAKCDLGLAVADVADDQAIHRTGQLHVALHVLDRRELIGRLGERERILHLDLPRRVAAERVARRRLARGVDGEQLARDVLGRLLGLALGLVPVRAAHDRQRRGGPADVAGDLVDALGREPTRPVGEAEDQRLA